MTGLLVDASLRITAAAAAVGLVLVVMRVRSGAVRHAAWSAVLVAMVAMPGLTAVVPAVDVAVPAAVVERTASFARDVIPAEAGATPAVAAPRATTAAETQPDVASVARSESWVPSWLLIATLIYGAGVVALLVRLSLGWYAALRMARTSTATSIINPVRVLTSAAVAAPLTAGVLRPVIVLPRDWPSWPASKLRAVLAHENAHVRRRDTWISLLAHINCALFWPHPLAWWLRRTLAVTAEHACDEAAAAQLGEPRRYAEVLLEIADTVQRRGARVAWQALGVNGSNLIGTRIDRLVNGDALARMSPSRRLATAVACAAVLVLAIACRQHVMPPPLRPDPEFAKHQAEQAQRTARFEAARDMTVEQADALEARLAANFDDWDAREQLVTYYTSSTKVPWDKKVPGLRRHALWLIEHHPEHELAPPALSPQYDPDGFAAARKLWDAHLKKPDASPFLIYRAARFFAAHDKPSAEPLILRGMAIDPNSEALTARMPPRTAGYHWHAQLVSLYVSALIGEQNAYSFDPSRTRTPYALQVREKLEASSDPALLARVGGELVFRLGWFTSPPELMSLARGYLERALVMDPQSTAARRALVMMAARERHERITKARRSNQPLNDADKLTDLAERALAAFMSNESLEYYKKDVDGAAAKRAEARKQAEETLKVAAGRTDLPTYSTSVMTAHHVLAAVALRDGERDAAVDHLMKSLDVPASDELRFGQAIGWLKPVNYLLKAGERERVAEFLERLAQLVVVERERLAGDAKAIREGRMTRSYQVTFRQEASGQSR